MNPTFEPSSSTSAALKDLGQGALRIHKRPGDLPVLRDIPKRVENLFVISTQEKILALCDCQKTQHPLLSKYMPYILKQNYLPLSYKQDLDFSANPWIDSFFSQSGENDEIRFAWHYLSWQISQIYHYKCIELLILEQVAAYSEIYEESIQYTKDILQLANILHSIQHVLTEKLLILYPFAKGPFGIVLSHLESDGEKIASKISGFASQLAYSLKDCCKIPIAQEILASVSFPHGVTLDQLAPFHFGCPIELKSSFPKQSNCSLITLSINPLVA